MVPRAGIEPATLSLEGSCSIQLSYRGMTPSVKGLREEYNIQAMKSQDHVSFIEKITTNIGSFSSLIIHTILFAAILLIGALNILSWDIVLLVLTTGVSLEAIYLAIFIQMSVNQQSQVIKDVEQDVDEIKVDVDEIQENVGEIQKDIDAIEEDVDDIQEDDEEDSRRDKEHQEVLNAMSANLQKLLNDIEKMKKS